MVTCLLFQFQIVVKMKVEHLLAWGCNDVFKELKNFFFLNVKCVLKPKIVIFVKSKNLKKENIDNFNPICFDK